jgi:hypothetical protein
MNQHQKQYALNRISDEQGKKLFQAGQKYKIDKVVIPDSQRIDMIFQGKVKLLPRNRIENHTDLCDSYDFSKYENEASHKDGYTEVCFVIKRTAQEAKDQIMLGDADEALKLIQKLENIKV